jgi:hypothetical protein
VRYDWAAGCKPQTIFTLSIPKKKDGDAK